MQITIDNCNNIDHGVVNIEEECLNIKYAINGTGKSSIAKLLEASSKRDSKLLQKLRPYNSENDPSISGNETLGKVLVFNENYVNQYLFQKDAIIKDAFSVFVKTPDYESRMSAIQGRLAQIKNVFSEHAELESLTKDLGDFIEGYGKARGLAKNGSIFKGLGGGNLVDNVPEDLREYAPYLARGSKSTNVKWLGWMQDGKNYLDIALQCPFCCKKGDDAKKRNNRICEVYDKKNVEHLNKVLELIESLSPYFCKATMDEIKNIANDVVGINENQKKFLEEIKDQVVSLHDILVAIKDVSFYSLREIGSVASFLKEHEINLKDFPHLDSDVTAEKIRVINESLRDVEKSVNDLQREVGIQKSKIIESTTKYQTEINDFLKCAGYNYFVSLDVKNENDAALLLKPLNGEENSVVMDVQDHLSYGERNAIALVLFVYSALREKPDLIVFDDPISSFDGNKKFAILNMLFLEKSTLKGNTILLLSHDFSIVVDVILTLAPNFKNTVSPNAYFLTNHNGRLEEKLIERGNIYSFNSLMEKNSKESDHFLNKLIYLRRLYEVNNRKDEVWDVLSNLFHKRKNPTRKNIETNEEVDLPVEVFNKGVEEIRKYDSSFDYYAAVDLTLNEEEMKNVYQHTSSNYEKLQIYRMIKGEMDGVDRVIRKFVNETYHVENDYIFQLDPKEYETVPQFVIDFCNRDLGL